MSHEESKSKNNKEEILPFGGYQGGMLRWNRLKKRGKYARRYKKKKDIEMMRRILSTTISN
jgi:hypothetical protein